MRRLTAYISGKVQKTGYRARVVSIARDFGLTGYVQNLDDGRVKVAKVNIDQNRATAIKYHVRSIPMLLLFKDGQIQASQVGAVGKGQLTQMIDKTLAA